MGEIIDTTFVGGAIEELDTYMEESLDLSKLPAIAKPLIIAKVF